MSVVGFFILLAIAVLLRFVGNKLAPVVMPSGRLKTIGLGWVGGFFGSWLDSVLWQFGPEVAGINLVAAAIGCAVFILFLGLFPFIKILLGKI
jgi:uncharacterized membrane protein YeaQ/YmgE (transglycosylase-associated protein family)